MSSTETVSENPSSGSSCSSGECQCSAERTQIDNSVKWPFLFFLVSGMAWLFTLSILGYLASWKAHSPEFLNVEFLTFGRVKPLFTNVLIYGFGFNFAFAIALWILARVSRVPLRSWGYLIVAGVFWNAGLKIGLYGIFTGDVSPYEFLELPIYGSSIMLIASVIISIWGILCVLHKRNEGSEPAQWYLMAALFWFPWFYSVAQVMLFCMPAGGVVQPLVASWYAGNLIWLWFGSISIAALYYLLPKAIGKELTGRNVAFIGFIVLALAGSWTGVAKLVGGPFPAWIITAGIAASIAMFAVYATALNSFIFSLLGSLDEFLANCKALGSKRSGLFIGLGAVFLILGGTEYSLSSLRGNAEILQGTYYQEGINFLLIYGMFGLIAFGAVYHALPRILKQEWAMEFLIPTHFWISCVGIVLVVVPLLIGGYMQGTAALDASIPFADVVKSTTPWLLGRSIGWIFLGIANFFFALNLVLTLFNYARKCCSCCCSCETTEVVGGAE